MIDRALLSEARFEFVVVSDTHYMLAPGSQALEKESRRRQSARAFHALQTVASVDADFVVHLGDLVQEFPESPGFEASLQEALGQLQACGLSPRHVAGNHDVGDKPDPTMPTDWVSDRSLTGYHQRFGRSWYSWNHEGYHFVVLNSQIMNGELSAVGEQQRWLERDLAASAGTPIVMFLHLAPFLVERDEPSLSHYDNIAEPGRSWLIDLIERHDVRLLFAGHSHFQFFNRIGATRFYLAPSTSFTRPGFSEVFSSVPPPEQGRDDTAKLGFFLVRHHDDGLSVHRVRTDGVEDDLDRNNARVVTRLPSDLSRSPLGVVARHPVAPSGEVPVAWPSLIRQPMRNDYPLLACLELGARYVRVPATDLADAVQCERLRMLRDEGVEVTAVWIWTDGLDLRREAAATIGILDTIELQTPGMLLPDPEMMRSVNRDVNVPITLAPLMPREIVPGKQHSRARIGYRTSELAELDAHLARNGLELDRVVGRVDPAHRAWDVMNDLTASPPLEHVLGIDWLVEFGTEDRREQSVRVAEALFAAALQPGCRVFFDPLADLDRTMDVSAGLIDRQSNPNPAFNVARLLNSILFRHDSLERRDVPWQPDHGRCIGLRAGTTCYLLVLPDRDGMELRGLVDELLLAEETRCYDLERGTVSPMGISSAGTIDRPVLLESVSA